MNQRFINVIAFAVGAAVGSLVTWKVVKDKYERIVQEEIASVKETWARMARENSDESDGESEDDSEDDGEDDEDEPEDDEEDEDFDESDYIQYNKLAGSYKHDGEGEGDDEVPYINGPYLITPEEFGNGVGSEHELHSITYYSDGVLADDWDVILDLDDTIGEESIEHFGDHVDDVIHVRNERLQADYEVVRDDRTYTDVLATRPQAKAYGY